MHFVLFSLLFIQFFRPTNHRPLPGIGGVEVNVNGKRPLIDDDVPLDDAVGDGKRPRVEESLTEILESDDDRPCYFKNKRKTDKETKDRNTQSRVSEGCSGAMHKLSLLTEKKNVLGTENELSMIMARGAGEFWRNYEDEEVINEFANEFICEKHLKELSTAWDDPTNHHYLIRKVTGSKTCSYPDEYHGSNKRPVVRKLLVEHSSITKDEAKAVVALEGFLLHVGLPVCAHHKKVVGETLAQYTIEDKGYNIDPRPEQGLLSRACVLTSLPGISKRTGVQVVEYNFSESQNGKSAADRVAGMVKNKVRSYVDSGKDSKDHAEFYKAATSGRLLEATSFYLASVEERPTSKNKVARISEFYDFRYESSGMRAWRHRAIGDGLFFPYNSFTDDGNGGSLWIMSKGGYFPIDGDQDRFWKKSAKKDDRPSDDESLFSCPELTCSESFTSLEDLEAHVEEGNHTISPLKLSLRDQSLHMFKAHLEGVAASRLQIPEVDDVVRELEYSDEDGLPKVEKGYALKKKKTSVRYKESAKEYICELFDEGIRTGTKIAPETAEKRMFSERNDDGTKRFSADERLNSRQISSFYSRITSDRKDNKGTSTICVKADTVTPSPTTGKRRKCKGKGGRGKREVVYEENDESEDIDEILVFSDAGFLSDADLIAMTVNESLHDIFDLNSPVEVFEDEVLKENTRWMASDFKFFDPNEKRLFDIPHDDDDDCDYYDEDTSTPKTELF